MKRFLLLSIFVSLVAGLSAQKVVTRVNLPANIAGGKVFLAADFGADLSTGVWTADAVCAVPNLACTPLTNAAEVAGKIALIDRGTCNFDQKCLNAQNAGAIGVLVMNHNDQNNRGGAPFIMGRATEAISAQVTIPCVMIGFEDGVALKAACAAGQTINITLGALPRAENDLAIYTNILPNYSETYVFNPPWGAIPNTEIQADGDFSFQGGAFFRNEGTATIDNINVGLEIKKGANSLFTQKTSDNVSLEVDSIAGLLNDTQFDFNSLPFAGRTGRYDFTYNASNDKADPVNTDNNYSTYMNVTNNILSKCRFNTTSKAPVASQYWGGGTAYRELLSPFNLRHGKGATIDSLFSALASNEPLAGMYVEGRIYKFTDLNGDGDIQNDELETVAIGSYTFPNSATGNFGTIRFGLDDLVGDPNDPYMVEDDSTLFFASLMYPGGANSFFPGYDVEFTQRQYFNFKDGLMELDITDWPYVSSSAQDAITGGPDLENAGLFYVDANGDGTAQDQEVAFFAPAIAVEINFPPIATRDLGNDLGVNIELSPVPTKDILNVSFSLPTASQVNYQIIGANGNLVMSQDDRTNGKEFRTSFNVANLPAGQYILKINTAEGYVKKAFTKVN